MMSDDIERISFSEEEIAARVRELGAQIENAQALLDVPLALY